MTSILLGSLMGPENEVDIRQVSRTKAHSFIPWELHGPSSLAKEMRPKEGPSVYTASGTEAAVGKEPTCVGRVEGDELFNRVCGTGCSSLSHPLTG